MVRSAANTYVHRTFSVTASSGITLTNADGVSGNTVINVASSATNAANNLVLRDTSGNFASNVITATSFVGNLTKSTTLAKTIVPDLDSTYDLGTSSLQWSNIHSDAASIDTVTGNLIGNVTGNLIASTTLAKTIVPDLDSTYDLGSSVLQWSNIHADAASIDTVTGNVIGNLTGNLIATTTLAKTVVPDQNSTYTLGTSSLQWSNIHADAANIDTTTGNLIGNVTGNLIAAISLTKTIVPDADSTYNIGSSTVKYANIYGDAAAIDTVTGNVIGNLTGNLLASTTLSKDIDPDIDSTYDLGSASLKWQRIFADAATIGTTTGNVIGNLTGNLLADTTLSKDIDPAIDSTYDLGSSSLKWQAIHAVAATIGTTTGNLIGNVTGNLIATTTLAKTISPDQNSTYTLGTSSLQWSNIHADAAAIDTVTGNVIGNLTGNLLAAITLSKNIVPDADSTYDLGSSTVKYANIYGDAANITAITGTLTGTATQAANLNNHDTDNLSEGTSNLYFTNTRADGRADLKVAAATGSNLDLTAVSTTTLPEGTNLYHTEARVQTKLDHAFEQLKAMLNNLATSTTLKLNLSGDPTPGAVVTLGSVSAGGVGGFTSGTNVATTGGTGTGLTVDTTVNADGVITAIALNQAGTDYLIGDTLTITNSNLGGVDALNLGTLSGGVGGFTAGTAVATTNSGSGDNGLTVNTTVDGNGAITNVVINAAGTGYAAGDTITIANSNAGGAATVDTLVGGTGYANGTAIATTTTGSGSGLTVNLTTSSGVVTGAAINAAGSGYAVNDTITIVNANASGVKTLGTIATAGTGYSTGTAIATTNDGSGSSLTVDISSVSASGAITAVAINDDGTGFTTSDTITIANANATGVKTLGAISAAGTGYTEGSATGVATTSSGSGTGLTLDIVVDASGNVTSATINNDGSGYAASEVITITGGNADATVPVSDLHGNGCTIPVSAIHGNGATIDIATIFANATVDVSAVFTNATFSLSDITTMEVGATITGTTSNSTGVITAMDASSVTVDNVSGFFKKGETVGANDVTNLTISSFG